MPNFETEDVLRKTGEDDKDIRHSCLKLLLDVPEERKTRRHLS